MKEMFLKMLQSMIPSDLDFRITMHTIEHQAGRTIAIKIIEPHDHEFPNQKMLADIAIEIPRRGDS